MAGVLLEGAKEAIGAVAIIDVFRAFTTQSVGRHWMHPVGHRQGLKLNLPKQVCIKAGPLDAKRRFVRELV